MNNNKKIIPIVMYTNIGRDKVIILAENKRKSGLYR